MFSKPCEDRKVEAGIVGRSFTGSSRDTVVCDIGPRHDIQHFVEIRNLLAFETRVECVSEILDDPKLLYFDTQQSGGSDNVWTRRKLLRSYADYRFVPVSVRSTSPGSGNQEIETRITVDRLRSRGTLESFSLSINVLS